MKKVSQIIGVLLVTAGVLVNRWTLGHWSSDGHINSLYFNLIIAAFESIALVVGVALLIRPGRQALINLCLCCLSLCVAFLLCETAVRLKYFGWRGLSPAEMNSTAWLANLGLLQASPYPDIGYELKPNLHTLYDFVPLRTNSAGMPGDEVTVEKPASTFRIAVVGDSFTMPAGVRAEEGYVARLGEGLMQHHFSDKRIECLNFGVAGYQPHQYRAVLEHKAVAYGPDLVVIGFCAENDDLFNDAKDESLLQPIGSVPPFFQSYLAKLVILLNTPATHHAGRDSNARDLAYVDAEFERIQKLCERAHAPVVVAFLANVPRNTENIEPLARKHGFGFVDCSAGFDRSKLNENSIYLPFDMHPNARANAVFAETICRYLTARH